jgi:hypothetical protein
MSVAGIRTAAGVELWNVENWDGGVTNETDPSLIPLVQCYTHFDLSTEQLGHTMRYNCWGFTFLPRRYWINSDSCVDQIIKDNCTQVFPPNIKPGDVIRYRDSFNITTHTGRVWAVDGSGNCTLVRSKWGGMGEYVHIPLHLYITPYGTNLAYFHQHSPLKGIIGDLWLKDSGSDAGGQYSGSPWWTSPDIIVDAPPYGLVDVNPKFGVVNYVGAVVHNRSEAAIANARVRYYWANPYAGFAPSNWKLIPGTAGHLNPTNTFTVPGYSSVTAPYVEWVPMPVPGVPNPAHQCLLAVVYVNDDPRDSNNPEPIVYPFDIPWDNNITLRNVTVVYLKKGSPTKLQLHTGVPFDKTDKLTADIRVSLNYVPRLTIFGIPDKIVPPQVKVSISGQRPASLVAVRELKKSAIAGITEKAVSLREIKRVPLEAKKPVLVELEITAPSTAQSGSNFYLNIEQVVGGQVTGGYTVVITIV